MLNYQFSLICTDGGYGWGRTGQRGRIIAKAQSLQQAEKLVKYYIPGGWYFEFEKLTNETPSGSVCIYPEHKE